MDLYSVNIDEADDVVLEADVRVVRVLQQQVPLCDGRQVPTFMVFKDGNKVGHAEGVGAGNLHVSESVRLFARPDHNNRSSWDHTLRGGLVVSCTTYCSRGDILYMDLSFLMPRGRRV